MSQQAVNATVKRLIEIGEFAEQCSISRSMVYLLIKRGELRSCHIGDRHLIAVEEADRFCARLLADA